MSCNADCMFSSPVLALMLSSCSIGYAEQHTLPETIELVTKQLTVEYSFSFFTNLPVDFSFDVSDVEEHFLPGQVRGHRQWSHLQVVLDVDGRAALDGQIEHALKRDSSNHVSLLQGSRTRLTFWCKHCVNKKRRRYAAYKKDLIIFLHSIYSFCGWLNVCGHKHCKWHYLCTCTVCHYHVVIYDHDVRDAVSVGVLQVVVGASVEDQSVAFLLVQDRSKVQRILAPRYVTT